MKVFKKERQTTKKAGCFAFARFERQKEGVPVQPAKQGHHISRLKNDKIESNSGINSIPSAQRKILIAGGDEE